MLMESKGFSYNPFYPVSLDSIAVFFFHTDAQTAAPKIIGCKYKGKPLPVQPFSQAVYAIKLPFFTQQTVLCESILLHGIRRTTVYDPWPVVV